MDVKKLGRIPDGGGWHVHGRGQGARSGVRGPRLGYAYLHTVLDDHSRLAYTEILRDEKGPTTAAFWHRACSWFADRGVRIERVLTDNGPNYRSRDVATALATTGAVHKRTRPTDYAHPASFRCRTKTWTPAPASPRTSTRDRSCSGNCCSA